MACEQPPGAPAPVAAEAAHGAPGDEALGARRDHPGPHRFVGEWDDEGVSFYQAFNSDIADWAIEHQKFGGPKFNPERMTWIKPSFAWMLYRAGYGLKDKNQNRVLKVKLSHEAAATILAASSLAHGEGPRMVNGRVQWDPARSVWHGSAAKRKQNMENTVEPEKDGPARAIQIGMRKKLSRFYVHSILSIQDVTELSRRVHDAHALWRVPEESEAAMRQLEGSLPEERLYMPRCPEDVYTKLRMYCE